MVKLFNKVKDLMFGEFEDEYEENEQEGYDDGENSAYGSIREFPRNREAEYEIPVANQRRQQTQQTQQTQQVQQRPQAQVHNLSTYNDDANDAKMIIAKPEKYEDSQGICDQIKQDIPVIVNLEKVEYPVAQRIMDFLSGTSYALDGRVQRVASNIFLFTPEHIDISVDFKTDVKSKGTMPYWAGNNR